MKIVRTVLAAALVGAGVASLLYLMSGAAFAQDVETSVAFDVGSANIGDCGARPWQTTLSGTYARTGGDFEAFANVTVAPFGGDCRQDAVSYNLEFEHSFGNWLAKFGADSRAVSGVYHQLGADGAKLSKVPDDLQPIPRVLPAGVADTITAILGRSFGVGGAELDVGVNIVPVDFAGGQSGQTLHIGYTVNVGEFDFRFSVDTGRETFGDLRLDWARDHATCHVGGAFGLDGLDTGEPTDQTVDGVGYRFAGVGAQAWNASVGCGVEFAL